MKKCLSTVLLLPVLAGCLSSAPPAPANWIISWTPPAGTVSGETGARPCVKLLSVDVRAPYNGTRLAVLRADGSVAFDAYNAFAAAPSALLRGAAADVLAASGAFDRVVAPGSTASAPVALELTVTRLALDCRAEGRRDASVALTLTAVANRRVLASAAGEAAVPVPDGDYSAAFSKAFADALFASVRALPPAKR